MATVGAIQTTIEQTTGRDDKSTVIQARILEAINEIQRRGNHYFMEDTKALDLVVDQQQYTPGVGIASATFKDISAIWTLDSDGNWDHDPLENLSFEEARQKYQADDEGDPEAYTFWRDKIYVWPPKPQDATKDIHVEQYVFLAALTFPSGTNELTGTWPDLVEAWATWKFYAKLPGAEEQARFWQPIAEIEYLKLVDYSHKKHLGGKHVLRVFTSPKLRSRSRALPFGGR